MIKKLYLGVSLWDDWEFLVEYVVGDKGVEIDDIYYNEVSVYSIIDGDIEAQIVDMLTRIENGEHVEYQ